ncbi:hypothetical protein TNCV_4792151 [Trichonephila clavipes]|nr:hypothetical protein TNCV_4792151 [Trichonephila clavipes]
MTKTSPELDYNCNRTRTHDTTAMTMTIRLPLPQSRPRIMSFFAKSNHVAAMCDANKQTINRIPNPQ